jgi:hypothetical protein
VSAAVIGITTGFVLVQLTEVRAKDRGRIKSQLAILRLTQQEGPKSLAQLVREQEAGIIEPGKGQVCTFTITNSFGGGTVSIVPPGGQPTDFEFSIGPGALVKFPEADGPTANLEQIFLRTNGITKALIHWEFCD